MQSALARSPAFFETCLKIASAIAVLSYGTLPSVHPDQTLDRHNASLRKPEKYLRSPLLDGAVELTELDACIRRESVQDASEILERRASPAFLGIGVLSLAI